mgnify:CR=1 FL=1
MRLIQSTPELESRLARVQYANGEESIILKTGARLDYLARSKGGGRGLGGKRVVIARLDEAALLAAQSLAPLPPDASRDEAGLRFRRALALSGTRSAAPLHVVGISLGGNALLRWAEEAGDSAAITARAQNIGPDQDYSALIRSTN